MSSDSKTRNGNSGFLNAFLVSFISSFMATVGGLWMEYKTGYFQTLKLERAAHQNDEQSANSISPSVPAQFPSQSNANIRTVPPSPPPDTNSTVVEEDIAKIYRLFRHNKEVANTRFVENKIVEVNSSVIPNNIVYHDHRPFVLALKSSDRPLLCVFNDEDTIAGIDDWYNVTVRGELVPTFYLQDRNNYLELRNCQLIKRQWQISSYLTVGFPIFIFLAIVISILINKIRRSFSR